MLTQPATPPAPHTPDPQEEPMTDELLAYYAAKRERDAALTPED